MEKTQNYNLNQWESADPIRREDFNADNAAIDAAIKAVAQSVAAAYSGNNAPWEMGTLDLTKVAEGDVVKSFDFTPSAIFLGATVYIPGFTANGGECRVYKQTLSDYYRFALNGDSLSVVYINGEPTTEVQYLALK